MNDITPTYIAAQLAQRAEEFVTWLLPAGEIVNSEWCVGSTKGESGRSCKIALQGEKAGKWADFAEGGRGGDLIDLLAAVRDIALGPAIREACEWLGLEKPKLHTNKPKTYVEPERPKKARAIDKTPAVATWLATRRISADVANRYKLLADGSDVVVFPSMRDGKLLHLKYRNVREKQFWASANTEKCLFGWQALNPQCRAVVLTEGEMDCLAMAEYGFQALSIPFGAGKGNKQDWIENEWENLERFDTIFLALDQDDAGRETVHELVERLGRFRCRVVELPRKDANQCLIDGVSRDEIGNVITAARTLDPAELRNARDLTDAVIDRFYPPDKQIQGFLAPWLALAHDFIFGWGETTIIAGFGGHGKSTLVGQVILDAMRQGVRTCVASLEFKSSKWLQWQVRQAVGKPDPSRELITKAMDWLGDGLWAIDIYGQQKADRLLEVFKYAHRRYGIKLWVIDNWSKLGIADDDLKEQKRVIEMLTEAAVVHNVHVIILAHLRKEETDMAIAASGKLGIKGSGALSDLVDNIFMQWRNRPKDKKLRDPKFHELAEDEQNRIRRSPDAILQTEKFRNGDTEPRVALYFDIASHTFSEHQGAAPYVYVSE